MIEIENVRKSFGALEVLKGIDLTVEKGEVVTIIGGSGSGKSTLLTCINGLEPIDSGKIAVDGTVVHAKSTDLTGTIHEAVVSQRVGTASSILV